MQYREKTAVLTKHRTLNHREEEIYCIFVCSLFGYFLMRFRAKFFTTSTLFK